MSPLTIWRGVTEDLSKEFLPGSLITWWAFSSCTTELTVLENNIYLGKNGNRTLFSIETINCRTIRSHSDFITEDEVILLPGTQMIVQSQFMPAIDLHIIHLKQIIPQDILLEPPFQGANFYPEPKKRSWYRKKTFQIPICLFAMLIIAAIIIASVLGTRLGNSENDTTINWKGGMWAFSCDFPGINTNIVPSESSLCGEKCQKDSNCTHFTWTNENGGTCFMKGGNVTKQDAFFKNDPTMICGVAYLNDYVMKNQTVNWEGNDWAYACDFPDNTFSDILSIANDCGVLCSQTPPCSHFTWSKYNGGTCFMKKGNTTKQDAVVTNDQGMVCGVVPTINITISNETIQWKENNTANSCDFHNNDLSSVRSVVTDCIGLCSKTLSCTHFTWNYHDGGTCFMKQGNVSKNDAFYTSDPTMMCGILLFL
ncbi:hypothetical protein I4U23_027375 [Adineta vaga]|nr:hypothetical protein I4U23_027375 [Adineta vaga]